MRLENKIRSLLSDAPADTTFDVYAHELWRDTEGGWTSNDRWCIAHNVTLDGVLEAALGRWEIFKINYAPRARVKDVEEIGHETEYMLEVGYLPFINIRVLA